MNKESMKAAIRMTIKLQPIVILYSFVSISSKFASSHVPFWEGNMSSFIWACINDIWLFTILFFMFMIIFLYAIIWQKLIKNIPITIMYANKSSYIFWTQLAAVLIFHETLDICNIAGIIIIFVGIVVVNSDE